MCQYCRHSQYYGGEFEQVFCTMKNQIRDSVSSCDKYEREPGLGEKEGD